MRDRRAVDEVFGSRPGRRVRVRRSDIDRILAEGATVPTPPPPPAVGPAEAVEQLREALEHAERLLGGRSAARRAELAEGLQELTDTLATTLNLLRVGEASAPRARSDT